MSLTIDTGTSAYRYVFTHDDLAGHDLVWRLLVCCCDCCGRYIQAADNEARLVAYADALASGLEEVSLEEWRALDEPEWLLTDAEKLAPFCSFCSAHEVTP